MSSSASCLPKAGTCLCHQHPANETKVAIVTGPNTGIGFEYTKQLSEEYGYTVIFVCRSPWLGGLVLNEARHFVAPLDLTSFASVKSFSQAVTEAFPIVYVFISNAGLNVLQESEYGLDTSSPQELFCDSARVINLPSVRPSPLLWNELALPLSDAVFWREKKKRCKIALRPPKLRHLPPCT